MIFEQHYLDCLSQAAYVIVGGQDALVVDPRRDADVYLEAAARHGATVRHVVLTHVHADFVTGAAELRAATGATVWMGRRFDGEFAGSWYQAWEPVELAPGQTITLSPTFTVTTNSIQAEGGQATLSLSGQVRVAYAGIERTLTRNLRGEIGAVAWEES